MKEIIEIKDFTKKYNQLTAVNNVAFSIYEGEMFGLVGPDGAGKTTTVRALCGLTNFNSGTIKLFDKNIKESKKFIQNNIGYLSQKFSLYGDLSIDENIEFFAQIHNVNNYTARRDELLRLTRLIQFRNRPAEKLSGGMKQKLALACSLIHKPKILFLDEPTTGVDPVSRRDFWKILSGLLKEGITIFLTTPYLDEAERCNRIAMMNKGEIIAINSPAKIKESFNGVVLEIVCGSTRKASSAVSAALGLEIQTFGDRINIVTDNYKKDLQAVQNVLKDNDIEIQDHRIVTPSIENVFIHLLQKNY